MTDPTSTTTIPEAAGRRPRRLGRRLRALGAVAGVLVAGIALAGCSSSNDGLASQYKAGTTQNYISGDGAVTEIAVDKRSDPIAFRATTDDGSTVSSTALKGRVVVLNFWYASCPPCRAEAPDIATVASKYADKKVTFIGVNVRDEKDTALAFERTFKVPYPSVIDSSKATMQLALSGTIAPNSVPTTIVLDQQGRVAARVLGALDSASILDTLVGDELSRSN